MQKIWSRLTVQSTPNLFCKTVGCGNKVQSRAQ